MSRYYRIGDVAKMLHAKLAASLAGPLEAFVPQQWVDEVLGEIGYRFRQAAFSPLGDVVGLHRASP